MRKPVPLIIASAIVIVVAVILVRAAREPEDTRTATTAAEARLAPADVDFITGAAQSNDAEAELAQLAQRISKHAEVKALADRLDRDHRQSNRELSDLVDKKDVDLPGAIGLPQQTEAQKAEHDRLDDLEGAVFDRAWTDHMVTSHEKSIQTYTRASQSVDPDVRAYAERTLPVLRSHLDLAKSIQAKVK